MGDWSSPLYIISQVLMILAHFFFAWTYFTNKRPVMLVSNMLGNLIQGIGYGFLIAWVGLAMCAVALARDGANYLINAKRKTEDKKRITVLDSLLLVLWTVLVVVITFFSAEGFLPWFACVGTIIFTFAIWQKNVLVYKTLGIFVYGFWMIYNIYIANLAGTVLKAALTVVAIVGLVLYIKRNLLNNTKLKENHQNAANT